MPSEPEPLVAYITAARAQGATDAFLVELLERQGWPRKEIYAAFDTVYAGLTGVPAPRRRSGFGDSAREAFLYLLSFGTLGVWTIGLGSLVFTLIDINFGDPLFANRFGSTRESISGSMASLIVGFPIYFITMIVLVRDQARQPDKAESDVRKWLTYLALLISAAAVIADLVTFVTYFLRGALTEPFVLKVLTVLVIAGGVFWYYLVPLQRKPAAEKTS